MPTTQEQEKQSVTTEALDKVYTLLAAALGMVAALAWNEAIKSIFNYYFPRPAENVYAQLAYAIAVTILVVVITIVLARYYQRARNLVNKRNEAKKKYERL